MENLTQVLLKSYYGFNDDKNEKKSLASHEGFQKELFEQKPVEIALNGNYNEEDSPGIRRVSEARVDNNDDNKISASDYLRNFEVLTEDDELIDDAGVDLGLENPRNEVQDDARLGIPKLGILERADGRDEEIEVGIIEETTPDSASDIASSSTKKKTRKKTKMGIIRRNDAGNLLPLIPKKNAVYNREFCDLTNSSIIEFPINLIDEIQSIRMLYLENNCLNELPEQLFTSLRFLQWLDVRNNWLRTIPVTIKNHPQLETILLQGNRIEKLPLELCLVPKLKTLQLAGNPLEFPPLDIISRGFNYIINFLRKEWNKENPNEPAVPVKELKSSSTILCDNVPSIKTSRPSKSTSVSKSIKSISIREKSRNYKPSNRCTGRSDYSLLDDKLRWITKVREMLIKQAAKLQKIKDREVLKEWRNDRRSYEKSMKKAAKRTEEDIPFGIDKGISFMSIKKVPMSILERKNMRFSGDMDKRMFEIVESLQNNQFSNESTNLGTDLQLKLLEHEIKKIERLYDEIQALKRQNDTSYKKYSGPNILNVCKSYEPPPPIIV